MSAAFILLVYIAVLVGLPLGYLTADLLTNDRRRR